MGNIQLTDDIFLSKLNFSPLVPFQKKTQEFSVCVRNHHLGHLDTQFG